jgi:predicted phosphodiesterase
MKIGILTDIHENTEMLLEALRLAEAYKCDELVCLGDIVGYDRRFYKYIRARSAKQCLELIRTNCRYIVAGNHDLFGAGRIPVYTNGFKYPEHWFSLTGEERKVLSEGKVWSYEFDDPVDLEDKDLAFLKSLPEYITATFNGISVMFSHYIYPDLTGSTTSYVERNNQLKDAWKFMDKHNSKYSFYGHSHGSFACFAYRDSLSFLKAFHAIHDNSFNLGDEMVIIALPPLAGEKGRTGFSIIDTETMKLNIISTTQA